jgi:hypothetical protein
MPKVRKGALVAFRVVRFTVTKDPTGVKPPSVTRDRRWHIGTVSMASREGKVKEVTTVDGERLKMVAKHLVIGRVLYIPADQVDPEALKQSAQGLTWAELPELEEFVSAFVI